MRHFRDFREIEAFMVDEYRRQGLTVIARDGLTIIPVSRANGADETTLINVTKIAQHLWEYLS